MTLRIDGLSIRRGGRRVVADLDAEIAPGRATLLRGPNGVGKTTLLRCLAGLVPASGGRATLDGRPLGPEAEGVALSGHLDAVKPQMTVAETLGFWARLHGAGDPARAAAAFGLDALADRPAGRLSAGQKRRLGLARLPLTGARLWLMDEPTVSLDAAGVAETVAILEAHLAAGGLALVATHLDLPLAHDTLTLAAPPADPLPDPFLAGFGA